MSTRLAVARALSIFGHPMLVMPMAAALAARAQGLDPRTTVLTLAGLLVPGALVMLFSLAQVRRGQWSHIDASAPRERRGLNRFLLGLFVLAAAFAAWRSGTPALTWAFALSAAIILVAIGLSRWCKLSLHVAFIAFAAWIPGSLAVFVGFGLLGLAVGWSRLALGRHERRDVLAGLLAGIAAGMVFRGA